MLPGDRREARPASLPAIEDRRLPGKRVGHRLQQQVGDGDLDAGIAFDRRAKLLPRAVQSRGLDPAIEGERREWCAG